MDRTDRLALPLLNAAQLQKEVWHNESLLQLDALHCGLMLGNELTDPPATPRPNCWHRLGAGATGEWASRDGQLAFWSASGWRYARPFDGIELRDADDGETWRFRDGAWSKGMERASALLIGGVQVVGARVTDIPDPDGGSVVDVECRGAIRQLLAAARAHGLIG